MSRNSMKKSLSNTSDCSAAGIGAFSLSQTVDSFGHNNNNNNNNKNRFNINQISFETIPPPLPPPPLPPPPLFTNTINHTDNNLYENCNRNFDIDNTNTIKFDKNIFKSNFLLRQFIRNSQTTAAIYASTNIENSCNKNHNIKFPIYENLCTGCGYGVFDSNGNLCNFCQCIINGYFDDQLQQSNYNNNNNQENHFYNNIIDKCYTGNNNSIYENCCKKCGEFCNSSECSECYLLNISIDNNNKIDKNIILFKECENQKLLKQTKQKRFFHGILDTLKRTKSSQHKFNSNCGRDKLNKIKNNNSKNSSLVSKSFSAILPSLSTSLPSSPPPPKHIITTSSLSSTFNNRKLEIIHNVDGFDNVFHTKDIFDIEKIAKLKINQKLNNNNCEKNKNIYGKLRKNGKSDDYLYKKCNSESIKSLNTNNNNNNRNSIKLLKHFKIGGNSTSKSDTNLNKIKLKKSSLTILILQKINERQKRIEIFNNNNNTKNNYKNLNILFKTKRKNFIEENIIEWMTSLRHQTHNYYINLMTGNDNDDVDDSICSIKSIPSKYYNNGCSFLNTTNTNYNTTLPQYSITTHRMNNELENSNHKFSELHSDDHKTTLLTTNTVQKLPVADDINNYNDLAATVVVDVIDSCSSEPHNKYNDTLYSSSSNNTSILLRKKMKTTNTITETNTNELRNQEMIEHFKRNLIEKQQQQKLKLRSKRKAIYLKTDDDDQLEFCREVGNINNSSAAVNNNNVLDHKNNLKGSLLQTNNRNGICDSTDSEFVSDLLSAFDSFLKRDLNTIQQQQQQNHNFDNINNNNNNIDPDVNLKNIDENLIIINGCENIQKNNNINSNNNKNLILIQHKLINNINNNNFIYLTTLNYQNLIISLNLSSSLNKIILFYDNNLRIFLQVIQNNKKFIIFQYNELIKFYKKFQKFTKYYYSKKMFLDNMKKFDNIENNNIKNLTTTTSKTLAITTTMVDDHNKQLKLQQKPLIRVTRPAPPPPPPIRSIHTKITTATNNNTKENPNIRKKIADKTPPPKIIKVNINRNEKLENEIVEKTKKLKTKKDEIVKELTEEEEENDENIYQPIWKFQTIGNPHNDNYDDTYQKNQNEEVSSNKINIDGNESTSLVEDDHGEWETDDEFMFTNKLNNSNDNNYVNINDNNNSRELNDDTLSLVSSTVSTLTGLSVSGSQSMIGATGLIEDDHINSKNCSNNKIHNNTNLYRSVCILYSPIELKLRAILYDYNRDKFNQISSHKNWPTIFRNNYNNEKLLLNGNSSSKNLNNRKDLTNVTIKMMQHEMISSSSSSINNMESSSLKNVDENINKKVMDEGDEDVDCGGNNNGKETFFLPDCVQAWKFMLLDISLMDDEEDMFVSNNELLQLNEIHSEDKILKLKDIDMNEQSTILPTSNYQRPLFKSASTDNLLDIPLQDKKSIGEKFRDKLHRGVLKLNSKQSKDTKKFKQSPQIYRRSLYLDDSVQEKYPIFGVRLDDVEMSQININVPLFVVDCIQLIEQKDSIEIDGLYRQSGNKTAIDDFKRKLTENYLFNLVLLKNEDIHTITGLLKSFFRELKTAIIPTISYEELPDNLMKTENLSVIRKILNQIPNPSKGTLKYLLKHLTTVANHSHENRMPASNLAIIWGPCILMSETTSPMDIARINTLMKVLIENYDLIFGFDELLS